MSGVATPDWYSTVAFSVARFTDARTTPGTSLRPRSILATHDAQDMPSIGIVSDTGLAGLLVPLPLRERDGERGVGAFAREGIIVTIGAAGGPMGNPIPRGPPVRPAAGSFSKVRLQPGAQK